MKPIHILKDEKRRENVRGGVSEIRGVGADKSLAL
jgi:hypothetical protein